MVSALSDTFPLDYKNNNTSIGNTGSSERVAGSSFLSSLDVSDSCYGRYEDFDLDPDDGFFLRLDSKREQNIQSLGSFFRDNLEPDYGQGYTNHPGACAYEGNPITLQVPKIELPLHDKDEHLEIVIAEIEEGSPPDEPDRGPTRKKTSSSLKKLKTKPKSRNNK
ncbi:hypothetical protein KY337_01490 [Candidatus Woesearchaeota archaeon]|nr:hypothetical protein [Candidatus Woesearchaeota archaeon]